MKKLGLVVMMSLGGLEAQALDYNIFKEFHSRTKNQTILKRGDSWVNKELSFGKGKVSDASTVYWKVEHDYGDTLMLLSLRTYVSDNGVPETIKVSFEIKREDVKYYVNHDYSSLDLHNVGTEEAFRDLTSGQPEYSLIFEEHRGDSIIGDYRLMHKEVNSGLFRVTEREYFDYRMPKELMRNFRHSESLAETIDEVVESYVTSVSMMKNSPIKFSSVNVDRRCVVKRNNVPFFGRPHFKTACTEVQ